VRGGSKKLFFRKELRPDESHPKAPQRQKSGALIQGGRSSVHPLRNRAPVRAVIGEPVPPPPLLPWVLAAFQA